LKKKPKKTQKTHFRKKTYFKNTKNPIKNAKNPIKNAKILSNVHWKMGIRVILHGGFGNGGFGISFLGRGPQKSYINFIFSFIMSEAIRSRFIFNIDSSLCMIVFIAFALIVVLFSYVIPLYRLYIGKEILLSS